jgi:battenin
VFSTIVLPDIEDNTPSTSEYTQLPVSEEDAGEAVADSAPLKTKALSIGEKWQLLKPLLPRYMAPLCMSSYFYVCTFDQMTHGTARPVFVYLVSFHPLLYASRLTVAKFEYTINQGVAPTLVYPIPTLETSPVFGHIIHSIRDYYPLWQVRCLLFCFILSFSRHPVACVPKYRISLSFIPLLWAASSSNTRNFNTLNYSRDSFNCTFVGISVGLFSRVPSTGSRIFSYKHRGNMWGAFIVSIVSRLERAHRRLLTVHSVNAYFRAGQEPAEPQERAFKMGAIGLADSLGILVASLVAMPTEMSLCRAQVSRGRSLCQQL